MFLAGSLQTNKHDVALLIQSSEIQLYNHFSLLQKIFYRSFYCRNTLLSMGVLALFS